MIHIVQCLCPQHHCLAALAFDPEKMPDNEAVESVREVIENGIASGVVNPWCGICKSRDLHYEVGVTRFKTLLEAAPHLREIERQNAIARAFLSGPAMN